MLTTIFVYILLPCISWSYLLGESEGDAKFQRCWQNSKLLESCPAGVKVSWEFNSSTQWIEKTQYFVNVTVTWTPLFESKMVALPETHEEDHHGEDHGDKAHENESELEHKNIVRVSIHPCKFSSTRICLPFVEHHNELHAHDKEFESDEPKSFLIPLTLDATNYQIVVHVQMLMNDTTHYFYEGSGENICSSNHTNRTVSPFPWKLDIGIGGTKEVVRKKKVKKITKENVPRGGNVYGIVFILSFVVSSAIALISAIWIFSNHKQALIRASQPALLAAMPLGGVFMTAAPLFTLTNQVTRLECTAPWVLWSIGFTVYYGLYILRAWRVQKIFMCAKAFERPDINEISVLLRLAGMLLIDVCLFTSAMIWSPFRVRQVLLSTTDTTETYEDRCYLTGFSPWYFVAIYKLICLLIGIFYAVQSRHITSNRTFRKLFVEFRYLASGIYVTAFSILIGAFMFYFVPMSPGQSLLLVQILTFFAFATSYLSLIIQKCMFIRSKDVANTDEGGIQAHHEDQATMSSKTEPSSMTSISEDESHAYDFFLATRLQDCVSEFKRLVHARNAHNLRDAVNGALLEMKKEFERSMGNGKGTDDPRPSQMSVQLMERVASHSQLTSTISEAMTSHL